MGLAVTHGDTSKVPGTEWGAACPLLPYCYEMDSRLRHGLLELALLFHVVVLFMSNSHMFTQQPHVDMFMLQRNRSAEEVVSRRLF